MSLLEEPVLIGDNFLKCPMCNHTGLEPLDDVLAVSMGAQDFIAHATGVPSVKIYLAAKECRVCGFIAMFRPEDKGPQDSSGLEEMTGIDPMRMMGDTKGEDDGDKG